jgi:hypothetical protein
VKPRLGTLLRRRSSHLPPNHGIYEKAVIRSVQLESLALPSVVKHDVETARDGNEQLFKLLVGVPAAVSTSRNII